MLKIVIVKRLKIQSSDNAKEYVENYNKNGYQYLSVLSGSLCFFFLELAIFLSTYPKALSLVKHYFPNNFEKKPDFF